MLGHVGSSHLLLKVCHAMRFVVWFSFAFAAQRLDSCTRWFGFSSSAVPDGLLTVGQWRRLWVPRVDPSQQCPLWARGNSIEGDGQRVLEITSRWQKGQKGQSVCCK